MANMGLAQPGSLVIDPFVGTGSILVAASTFGSLCFGTDIDIRVLKGKSNSKAPEKEGKKSKKLNTNPAYYKGGEQQGKGGEQQGMGGEQQGMGGEQQGMPTGGKGGKAKGGVQGKPNLFSNFLQVGRTKSMATT
jgi:hypothetical protein